MSKYSQKITGIIAGLLMSISLQAADKIAVNPSHPDKYVVQHGDNLWDIAQRFLAAPWRWPEVWNVNPQIGNPHLIYPGDTIVLSFDANGNPILSLNRDAPVRAAYKLRPKIRSERIDLAIPTIPLDHIRPFLTRPFVVESNSLDNAPYVLAFSKEHIRGSSGQKLYIRNATEFIPDGKYYIVRPSKIYKHGDTGETLGQEAIYVGQLITIRNGDPVTAMVLDNDLEIVKGDRLIPIEEDQPVTKFFPKPPTTNADCSIISDLSGVTQIAQFNVVALDCGHENEIAQGDVMTIDKRGYVVTDPFYTDEDAPERRISTRHEWFDEEHRSYPKVEKFVIPDPGAKALLPDEPIGTLMVFRTFPKVSFALVLRATDAIHLLDRTRNPEDSD
jgi:signal peptidase I